MSQSGQWPMFCCDIGRTGFSSSHAASDKIRWSASTGSNIYSSPVVKDDRVYIGAEDGRVYCYRASTGDLLWFFQTGGAILSTPAIAYGKLFVGSNDNRLYCIDGVTGQELWNFSTGHIINSHILVHDNYVYFGSNDKCVYCLHVENGTKKWGSFLSGMVQDSAPVLEYDRLYIGASDHKVYCINITTGSQVWSYQLVGDSAFFAPSPVVFDGFVYVGSRVLSGINYFYKIHAKTGQLEKRVQTPGVIGGSPAVYNRRVYFGCSDKKLYCLNTTDLRVMWSYETGGKIFSSPTVTSNVIYFGSTDNYLYCLNIGEDDDTIRLLWKKDLGNWVSCSPALVDGSLFVTVQYMTVNNLWCFQPNNPPNTPQPPIGPTQGTIQQEYTYIAATVEDPEDDLVEYLFDWGDESTGTWRDTPQDTHIWSQPGLYLVRVKTRDKYFEESSWSESLQVYIMSSEGYNQFEVIMDYTVVELSDFTVTIRDKYTQLKVQHALVTFNEHVEYTDEQGQVRFIAPDVKSTSIYNITISKEGYQTLQAYITVLTQQGDTQQGWIYGRVTDELDTPLPEVSICVAISQDITRCAQTNEKGEYYLQLSSGIYVVTAMKPGYQQEIKRNVMVSERQAISVNFVLSKTEMKEKIKSSDVYEQLLYDKLAVEIQNNRIGGKIIVAEKYNVTIYNPDLLIEINPVSQTQDIISFTATADASTSGQVIMIKITNFKGDITVKVDEKQIDEAGDTKEFFDPSNTNQEYMKIKTTIDTYVLVHIPYFSSHTIVISSVTGRIFTYPVPIISGCLVILVAFYVLFRRSKEE
ncbi:MAG: PQQ-binding-like beta-propeller repeat protein [Candidatus Thermoplasmatota archaeon]